MSMSKYEINKLEYSSTEYSSNSPIDDNGFNEWMEATLKKEGKTIETTSASHLTMLTNYWFAMPILFGKNWKKVAWVKLKK